MQPTCNARTEKTTSRIKTAEHRRWNIIPRQQIGLDHHIIALQLKEEMY